MPELMDPAVKMPASLQRQIDRGKEIRAALEAGETVPPSSAEPNVVIKGTIAPVEQAPGAVEAEGLPAASVEPKVDDPPPANPTDDVKETNWEARYQRLSASFRTLQGKYASETSKLRKDIEKLQGDLQEATSQIVELSRKNNFQKPSDDEKKLLTTSEDDDILDREDEERFGSDFLRAVNRRAKIVANQLVSAQVAELQARIDKLGGSVSNIGRATEQTARDRLKADLSKVFPEWREVDEDPLFHEWLEDRDAFSGLKRADIFANAVQSNDCDRVVMVYKGYSDEQKAVGAHTRPNGNSGRVRTDTLAAPSGGRATPRTPTAPAAPEGFTGQQIRDFYEKKRRGQLGMSDAEIADMEARIHQAGVEGRVRSGPRV
jgi:hypothetical protein